MRRQSLKQAVKQVEQGKINLNMEGLPFGGWAETQQRKLQILDLIPPREFRTYSVNELIDAVYTVDASERFRRR